jgi:hypothetical protein
MTKKEIIDLVIDLYEQARHIALPNGIENNKIRRGRSRIVAGQAEELFAHFVALNIPNVDKVLVDQPISFRPIDKAKTIYPDILPIINQEISIIIDLKMDLGMKRDQISNIYNSASNLLDEIRGKEIWYRDGLTKEMFTAKVSEKLVYFIVVISKKNINKSDLERQINDIDFLQNKGKLKFYFLTDNAHPNWQDSQAAKDYIEILNDFDEFIKDLQSIS